MLTPTGRHRRTYSARNGNGFSVYRDPGSDNTDEDDGYFGNDAAAMRTRIEASGAVTLAEEGVTILPDGVGESVTKERIPYISAGGLEKLVINVLLLVYIP